MYSERIIQKTLDGYEHKNGWRPQPRSIKEVEDFRAYIDSLTDMDQNSVNSYFSWKYGRQPSKTTIAWIRNWIENEQFMCFASAEYFITRYSKIRAADERIIGFQFRLGQKIFLALLAEHDDLQIAIQLFVLKCRQVGISTAVAQFFLHRILFRSNTYAVMASVQAQQSEKLGTMVDTAWLNLPFWLPPAKTTLKASDPKWANGSLLSIQSGNQEVGIAQGSSPSCVHISELGDYTKPKKVLEEGLLPACHQLRSLFMVWEGTGSTASPWQREKWDYYSSHNARFKTIFIPPCCAPDLYPPADWLRAHPIPIDWRPSDSTLRMRRRGELFVRSTDYLWKFLGQHWEMDREYMWSWENGYNEAVASHSEKTYLSQTACVTGDTLISTEKGIIPISTAKGVKFCESGEITNWIPKGDKPVIELHLKSGRILQATKDHRIHVVGGKWMMMGDLSLGDKVLLSLPMFAESLFLLRWNDTHLHTCERLIDEKLGRLLGYFMGDGCYSASAISFSCDSRDVDVVEDIVSLIWEIFQRKPYLEYRGGCTQIRLHATELVPLFRAMDAIIQVKGKENWSEGWKRNIRVPAVIMHSPKEVVRHFLSALFECDGFPHKDSARSSLTSSKDGFLREVQMLLLGFGINSKFMKKQSVSGNDIKGGRRGHIYTKRNLDIPAAFVNKFYDEIGFISNRKKYLGKRQDCLYGKGTRKELFDEVMSVVATGNVVPVYDLTVKDAHLFSANGIEVHNCTPDEAFQSKNDPVFNDETINVVTKQRELGYKAYAITGKTILMGSDNKPYEPNPDQIDWLSPRVQLHWEANDGNQYDWELVPLLAFDDSDDINCFDKLLVFESPQDGGVYALGIDTADGLGLPNEDRSTLSCHLYGEGRDSDRQVASFTSLRVNSAQMSRIAACVAVLFGTDGDGIVTSDNPLVMKFIIEQIRKPGDECQHQLKIMGFLDHHIMHSYDSKGNIDQNKGNKEGWRTSKWSRPILLNRFVNAVNTGWLILHDPIVLRQLKTFVRKEKNGLAEMGHESGQHDDNIFGCAMPWTTLHDFDNDAMKLEAKFAPRQTKAVVDSRWASNSITI